MVTNVLCAHVCVCVCVHVCALPGRSALIDNTGTQLVIAWGSGSWATAAGYGASNGDQPTAGFHVGSFTSGQTLSLQYYITGSGTSPVYIGDGNGYVGIIAHRIGN